MKKKSKVVDPFDMGGDERPELFIGLVGAVGINLAHVKNAVSKVLRQADYEVHDLHLTDYLRSLKPWAQSAKSSKARDKRIRSLMDAGNQFREKTGRNDAMALLGIYALNTKMMPKKSEREIERVPAHGNAFIFRQLKHPAEVATLRNLYGPHFRLISVYQSVTSRMDLLSNSIAKSRKEPVSDAHRETAKNLADRDQAEGIEHGQSVRDVFPLADLFIDAEETGAIDRQVTRFLELLFGHPYHTPTREEYAMFQSYAASLRSSDMSRQVGAVITRNDAIIAVGANEVPKAFGGFYWTDDQPNESDWKRGFNSADTERRQVLKDLITRMMDAGFLKAPKGRAPEGVLKELLDPKKSTVKGSRVMDLNEFGRSVHAEMAALTDAARRGVMVEGGTMYVTTFPCNECARHIIASGLREVAFIEPYPKSKAIDLHRDAAQLDGRRPATLVWLRPFTGISPRSYIELFQMRKGSRKDESGYAVEWTWSSAQPSFNSVAPNYGKLEVEMSAVILEAIEKNPDISWDGSLS